MRRPSTGLAHLTPVMGATPPRALVAPVAPVAAVATVALVAPVAPVASAAPPTTLTPSTAQTHARRVVADPARQLVNSVDGINAGRVGQRHQRLVVEYRHLAALSQVYQSRHGGRQSPDHTPHGGSGGGWIWLDSCHSTDHYQGIGRSYNLPFPADGHPESASTHKAAEPWTDQNEERPSAGPRLRWHWTRRTLRATPAHPRRRLEARLLCRRNCYPFLRLWPRQLSVWTCRRRLSSGQR